MSSHSSLAVQSRPALRSSPEALCELLVLMAAHADNPENVTLKAILDACVLNGHDLASMELTVTILAASYNRSRPLALASADNVSQATITILTDDEESSESSSNGEGDNMSADLLSLSDQVPGHVRFAEPALPRANPADPYAAQGPWNVGRMYSVVPTGHLEPASEAGLVNPRWYVVTRGFHVGITTVNGFAVTAVSGASRGRLRSFANQDDALIEFNLLWDLGQVTIAKRPVRSFFDRGGWFGSCIIC
uniref:Uncharacterized protein n=1 Tax=Mycena chlorophos TaxID=658473 RepID=A0ABQ0L3S2_MYCCL|nr:predicted protein [Mycena chlorophos]